MAIAVGFLLAGLAAGEFEARGGEPISLFAGTVRDTARQPVAGATVWLTTHSESSPERSKIVAETRTDEAGRFSFSELPPDDSDRSAPTVVVRDSQGRIGWDGPLSIYDRAKAISLRIEIREFVEVRGRVIDDDGKGVASALVRPSAFGESDIRFIGLPGQVTEQLAATTAADGGFILPRVPASVYLRCDVSADGFGRSSVNFKSDQPATIQLSRAGSIAGRLAPPAGYEPATAGFKLRVTLRGDTGVRSNYAEDVVVNGDGTFRSGSLSPGWYLVAPAMNQPFPFFAEPLPPLEVKPGAAIEGISIPLHAGVALHGRVVARASGAGIENVELTAACVFPTTDGQVVSGYQHVTTGADGRFTVLLAAGKANIHVTRAPPEFLVPAHHFGANGLHEFIEGDEWPAIALEPAARVEALVVDENGNALEGAEVRYDSTLRERPRVWGPIYSGAGGRFSMSQVDPRTQFSLRARTDTATSDVAKLFTPAELDGPVKLTVSPGHAFRLRGKLVDNAGKSVPNAEVSILWRQEVVLDQPQIGNRAGGRGRQGGFRTLASSALDHLTSNSEGSFETAALWPGDSYQVVAAAAGFAPLETDIVRGAEGKALDLGSLVLKRNDEVVSGLVVDEEGRPVAAADIHFASPWGSFHEPVSSDADGRFQVQPVDLSAPLLLRARTATAASDGALAVLPEELSQPVELVVAPRHAIRWQGKVFDRQGKPVAGVNVSVVWDRHVATQRNRETLSRRTTTPNAPVTLDRVATAADGTFETQALWPGEKYRLVTTSEGYDSAESAVDRGAAGQTRVANPLVLRRSDLAVEGRVVDSAGHPLEGATVVNSGDSPRRVRSTTDAAGRFRLCGLYDGNVYVLARKLGYRAAGWRGSAGAGTVEIKLIGADGPLARAVEASQPTSRLPRREPPGDTLIAEQREFARKQLTELWKLRDRFDEGQTPVTRFGVLRGTESRPDAASRVAVCMARLDVSRALKWSAAEGGRFDETVQVAAAESAAHHDLEGAILQLAEIKTPSAGDALMRMARRKLAAGPRDEAVRLLEAARSCPRPISVVEIFALAVAAGQEEWGRPLIEQLAEGMEKVNPPQPGLAQNAVAQFAAARGLPPGFVDNNRGNVAVALAAFDAARAVRLLNTMGEQRPNANEIYIARAAVAMGAYDSKRARELMRRIDNPRTAYEVRMKIAYQLAATDLDAALGWIDEIGGDKAEALSWIAQVVARRDKQRAYALIDRALDLYQSYGDNDYGGRPVEAAAIAVRAGAIDYPDMPSVIDRVLAARLTAAEEPSAARLVESVVNTARVLALVDRAVARELLLTIEPQAALVGTGGGSVGRGQWLQAWALADFGQAERRYAEEFAAQARQPRLKLVGNGLLPMIELLVEPPSERARFILGSFNGMFWFPGDE